MKNEPVKVAENLSLLERTNFMRGHDVSFEFVLFMFLSLIISKDACVPVTHAGSK